jgi:hypothetical protein
MVNIFSIFEVTFDVSEILVVVKRLYSILKVGIALRGCCPSCYHGHACTKMTKDVERDMRVMFHVVNP